MNALRILLGSDLRQATGRVVSCKRSPEAVLKLLVAQADLNLPDAWVIAGIFEEDRRGAEPWKGASVVMLDLDYEDPALPKDEGAHQEMPSEYRTRLVVALENYRLPAFAYTTRRGLRLGHVLRQDVTEAGRYEELAESAAESLLDHLEAHGVSTWRRGELGLRYDAASGQPWQTMRLPLEGQLEVLCGTDRPVDPEELLGAGSARLDLHAALPREIADACTSIGAWIQIAPEVVVTGLMALASTTIGNTRRVAVRGIEVPLSLHYLTVLVSGSGKSEVRKYLRKAVEPMIESLRARKREAECEDSAFKDSLDEWKAKRRKADGEKTAGSRPTPPALHPRGGQRASLMVSEGTLEGIIDTIDDTPRGILWATHEAHEILGLLGRYSDKGTGRSLDAARLRKLMDSDSVEAHRARSNSTPIRTVEVPWLAIDADVQPEVALGIFNHEDRHSGLTARWLIHQPPSMQGKRRYVDPPPEPGPEVLLMLRARLEALWRHELDLVDGIPQPKALPLDPTAETTWAKELERMERRYPHVGAEETGALGHARGRVLRLAGVLALLKDPQTQTVTDLDMRRAIHHMGYHHAQGRQLLGGGESDARRELLDRLEKQTRRIFERNPTRGATPRELARRVNKARYQGDDGRRRAIADLNALGWTPRRPPAKGKGRKPQVGWFPPGSSAKSAKAPRDRTAPDHSADSADRWSRNRHANGVPAVDLLDRASEVLIARQEVVLPPPGRRGRCPLCDSSDGLGVLPDDPTRWYCHSDRHLAGGCAVDLALIERHRKAPTPQEAVEEAKRILGEGAP